ncbi:cupin domain-containing protein [Vibrio furnissii]|uniref:cupin domain-containing protein n=1 Tax=Vibrio furnissii TaxID=29494 RepID=UPI001EEADED4|nr:cupin domain-containing protein [Vibrio furnissii]MCG6267110.1 cupin domain-containing protein [Vibrio furnissii]
MMNKTTSLMLVAATTVGSFTFSSAYAADGNVQHVYRAQDLQSFEGPENLFTGKVRVDMLFPENETAHYSAAYVTFQPGARTAWHSHPAGQHMFVTQGEALTGTRDGKVIHFHQGESVWCPPNVEHWHGATPNAVMTHLVVTGADIGCGMKGGGGGESH